jgi:hypothetical protein
VTVLDGSRRVAESGRERVRERVRERELLGMAQWHLYQGSMTSLHQFPNDASLQEACSGGMQRPFTTFKVLETHLTAGRDDRRSTKRLTCYTWQSHDAPRFSHQGGVKDRNDGGSGRTPRASNWAWWRRRGRQWSRTYLDVFLGNCIGGSGVINHQQPNLVISRCQPDLCTCEVHREMWEVSKTDNMHIYIEQRPRSKATFSVEAQ